MSEVKKGKYDRDEVLSYLRKKHNIVLDHGTLCVPTGAHIGIKDWGKIDFLKASVRYVDRKGNFIN